MIKTKWEYCRANDFNELHVLGRQGWELVGVTGAGSAELEADRGATFYLKRPVPSIREQITSEQRDRALAERQGTE
ncbi:hypothetical protein [Paenibacillus sp. FSL H7-0331]|uniref:hypothetical protein n=1 Tax=Paenibacillus sp. FSL H7-0331 TaxID=1920421 RepID=UPI00096E487A|nr:hypothetical protein [Paenibacillus sp. FSL H7-0331]OMF14870.1 hypothetical protein BK127_16830 [Paenibacillus sp. FSL H7-0331]